jgi:hypothetical protein
MHKVIKIEKTPRTPIHGRPNTVVSHAIKNLREIYAPHHHPHLRPQLSFRATSLPYTRPSPRLIVLPLSCAARPRRTSPLCSSARPCAALNALALTSGTAIHQGPNALALTKAVARTVPLHLRYYPLLRSLILLCSWDPRSRNQVAEIHNPNPQIWLWKCL